MVANLRSVKQRVLPITEIEHSAFCKSEDELPAKPLAEELKVNIRWQNIPPQYLCLTAEELDRRIHDAREELGELINVRIQATSPWSLQGTAVETVSKQEVSVT